MTGWLLATLDDNLKLLTDVSKAAYRSGFRHQNARELNSFQQQGVRHGRTEQQVPPRAVEQGQTGWSESTLQTEGNLGYPFGPVTTYMNNGVNKFSWTYLSCLHVAKVLPSTLYTNRARMCKRNRNVNDRDVMKPMLFKPGFRIDVKDVIVILLGITGVWFVEPIDGFLALVIGLTVGHFFLFCNVFRLARRLELAWTMIFVGLCICHIAVGQPGVTTTLICTSVATAIVISSQLRNPVYHGIGWQRINPGLTDWWKAQFESFEGRCP